MTPERYEEILTELRDPQYQIRLSPNPTTMGPSYIGEMISTILLAKTQINNLAEEVELALVKNQTHLNDLEEEAEARFDIAITTLTEDDTEGMDATARQALARRKVESAHREDQVKVAALNNQPTPTTFVPLREKIKNSKSRVLELKTLLKLLTSKRDELTRLDSGIRLQLTTIQTEATLYPKGEPLRPTRGRNGSRTRGSVDDSVDREDVRGLVESEDFTNLIEGTSNPSIEE
jgi:hypothetical protein